MIQWWNSLDLFALVYALIAVPATLVLILQTLLLFFGIGADDEGIDLTGNDQIDTPGDGGGDGLGKNVMNPETVVVLDEGAYMEMETTQIKGVDSTIRTTHATVGPEATLIIKEKVMTHGKQLAKSDFTVDLNGDGCHTNVISRSVAKGESKQIFLARINGNARCYGHSECDAIIMDNAKISAIPEITANHLDAALIHEAAIGKIAGEQLIKLMTLGLTEQEAEEQIVSGFLK